MADQIIYLHPRAPAKPAPGTPCNGCGVCCAIETCPAGLLLYHQRRGPCPALIWIDAETQYRCKLVLRPEAGQNSWTKIWNKLTARLFRRWIAAGKGCDCDYQTVQPQSQSLT